MIQQLEIVGFQSIVCSVQKGYGVMTQLQELNWILECHFVDCNL